MASTLSHPLPPSDKVTDQLFQFVVDYSTRRRRCSAQSVDTFRPPSSLTEPSIFTSSPSRTSPRRNASPTSSPRLRLRSP